MTFIALSQGIYSNSRSYREMRFQRAASREFVLDESFRERILKLVFQFHLNLDLSGFSDLTDDLLVHVDGVHSLDMSRPCDLITDRGYSYLSHIHTLTITHCHHLTDTAMAWECSYFNLILL
jgi:hypothetical protein